MTTPKSPAYLVADVHATSKEGFSLAHSADLPGFNLCVSAGTDLSDEIGPAIEWFMKESRGMSVSVEVAARPSSITNAAVSPVLTGVPVVMRQHFASQRA